MTLALAGCGGSKPDEPPAPTAAPKQTPAPRTDVAAVASRSHVPVLCYHQIREPTSADSAADRQYIVRPSVLEAQMQALTQAGYTHGHRRRATSRTWPRGAKLPRKPILLTFDDASAGQYTRALPILKRHHFVATFFVMTVVLGKDGWLTQGPGAGRSTAPG